jgi:N-methylhydantoinase B
VTFTSWAKRGLVPLAASTDGTTSARSVTAGGLRAPDPELHELINPYTVLQYEYWRDSAGPGQWRGGMGTVYRWRVDADGIMAVNFGGGVNEETRPYGLEGGLGSPKSKLVVRRDGEELTIDTETFFALNRNDEVEIYETGGGGYGDPRARDPERIADDVADGFVSAVQASEVYGAQP